MKYSLIAFLTLCFSMSFAQSDLFVSNGSYVFVDGTAFTSGPTVAPLYVTDDINLDTNGHIYLRNDAQLLQGDGTVSSTNTGEGELSVYQEGNVNKWSYNYWCSPVGNNSATLGNEPARVNLINHATNIITVDDPNGLISSSNALFTAGTEGSVTPLILTISDRWLWTYQLSNLYADWAYVGATGDIKPGLGFTMKGIGELLGTGFTGNQLYDFRGKPNDGTIENDVVTGLNTLVGNPYPSAMDAAAFIWDPTNQASITGDLLFWEQSGTINSHVLQLYQGGYYSFTINEAGTVITDTFAEFETYDEEDNSFPLPTPTNGSKTQGKYIPIGQGFMVLGSAGTIATPATVVSRNAHRVFHKESDGNSFFFRSSDANNQNRNETSEIQYQSNGLSIVPEDYKRFRINVDFTNNEAQYTRQLVLNFHDSATAGFDYGLELTLTESLESDSYFTLDENMYLGQAFPFEDELKIPLFVDIEAQQPLRFRIFDIQNFEASQGIYIHDNENDTYVNLRNLDYELNIEPGNYTDRFEIVFRSESALDIDEFDSNTLTINQNNSMHQLSVLNPKSLDITSIEVFDVTGKRLLNGNYNSILNRYELSTTSLSDGVYVVNVKSNTSAVKSQKIIVKN
jgi:hypothetical protein